MKNFENTGNSPFLKVILLVKYDIRFADQHLLIIEG
jgi:hypothetical protein